VSKQKVNIDRSILDDQIWSRLQDDSGESETNAVGLNWEKAEASKRWLTVLNIDPRNIVRISPLPFFSLINLPPSQVFEGFSRTKSISSAFGDDQAVQVNSSSNILVPTKALESASNDKGAEDKPELRASAKRIIDSLPILSFLRSPELQIASS